MRSHLPPKKGYRVVFSASIRLKTGRVLFARDYGLRAFAFYVKD